MAKFTPDQLGVLMDFLTSSGRTGLLLADMVNQKFGASAQRREAAEVAADRKISDDAVSALMEIEELVRSWNENYGPGTKVEKIMGTQTISVKFIAEKILPIIEEARPNL